MSGSWRDCGSEGFVNLKISDYEGREFVEEVLPAGRRVGDAGLGDGAGRWQCRFDTGKHNG